jgi:hypothetical protein
MGVRGRTRRSDLHGQVVAHGLCRCSRAEPLSLSHAGCSAGLPNQDIPGRARPLGRVPLYVIASRHRGGSGSGRSPILASLPARPNSDYIHRREAGCAGSENRIISPAMAADRERWNSIRNGGYSRKAPRWGERVEKGWRGEAEPYPELGEGVQPGRKPL